MTGVAMAVWRRPPLAAALALLAVTASCRERAEEAPEEEAAPAADLRALAPQVMIGSPTEMEVVAGDSVVVRLTMLSGFPMERGGGPGHLVVELGDRAVDHYSLAEPVVFREVASGCQLLRAAIVDAVGRTLDTPGALDYRNVCVGRRGRPAAPPGTPVLFSNSPRDSVTLQPGDSLLIDFRVSGASLGPGNYRVRWAWDHQSGEAPAPGPVWLKDGLEAGPHRLRLELVGPPGQPSGVPVIERTVTLRALHAAEGRALR